jgi:hypothetical protein
MGHGHVSVLDEIVIRHGTTHEACAEFLARYARHRGEVLVFGDASGHHQMTSGASDYEMVREYLQAHSNLATEYRTPRANPSVRLRVNLMNAKLRTASGQVEMLVDGKCKELIKDFEQVMYKEDTGQIDKDRDRMRTHLSDALGYMVWLECRLSSPIGEQNRRMV